MIIGLIAMYMPKPNEIGNISKYIGELDYCYLLDDSAQDNSSVVQTLLEEHPGKVQYYKNPYNMGLVRSVNNGFRMAIDKHADWILVMNPDGTFQNDAISIYREYIDTHDTSKVAIIAPIYNLDRRKREASSGYKSIKFPDMSGCLYNAEILSKLDFYDPKTYFYSLDIEYCIRARRNGYKIIECSEAVLNHHPAETYAITLFGKTIFKCGKDNPQRYYYQFRSAFYINSKFHDLYNLMISVYKWLKVVLFFDNKKEYFKMIKLGIQDAKRGFFGNIKDREN